MKYLLLLALLIPSMAYAGEETFNPNDFNITPDGSSETKPLSEWLSIDYTNILTYTGTGNYTITKDIDLLEINKTIPEQTTVFLTTSPYIGETHTIKDGGGNAVIYNITIDASPKFIDGTNSIIINNMYESVTVYFNGTKWGVK